MRNLDEFKAHDLADNLTLVPGAPVAAASAGQEGMIPARPFVYQPQTLTPHAVFDAPASPSLSDEVSYIAGIDGSGNAVATTFWSWQYDSPPTYAGVDAHKWGNATSGTAGGTIKYYFSPSSNWTATEKAVFVAALTLWSDEVNIQFSETTDSAQAQLTFQRGNDGSAYEDDTQNATGGGLGSNQLNTFATARISIDTSVSAFGPIDGSFVTRGGYMFETIVHELGHAIGLGHGGAYNGTVVASTDQYSAYDMRLWDIMSYLDTYNTDAKYAAQYPVTGTDWGITPVDSDGYQWYNDPSTTMPLDILAAQRLYGASTSGGLSGGQVFGFNCNISDAAHIFFDFTINTTGVVTLFDTGTGNTLDLSGYTLASTISLVPGTFSSANGKVNNIGIAFATWIDTAIGGSGNDVITGNTDANTLNGGAGADTLAGGAGDDTYIVDNASDAVTENAAEGTDTVKSSVTYTLGANVENLTLTGSGDINGTGNELDNVITGNSGKNNLAGGLGADTIILRAQDLNEGDKVNGGAGTAIDRLNFSTAGTITADAFVNVSHIEMIHLANGSNRLVINDALVGSVDDAHKILMIYGNAGDDIIDASAVTTATNRVNFYSGAGNDTLTGGAGADTFFFTAGGLTSGDIVSGGAGATTDSLNFYTAGTIVSSAFAHVSHIEAVSLANGANSLTLTDALVGSADNGKQILRVYGNAGDDVIDASAVTTATHRLNIYGGAGNDTLTGGAGADTFYFAMADLTSGDTVNGGTGTTTDALSFSTAGTLASGAFAHVSHIELINLANGANNVTLTDALVGSADNANHILSIVGNAGNDVVDASAVTTAANRVYIYAGAGNDTLTGGAGTDSFFFAAGDLSSADIVNGGTGTAPDYLRFSTAGTIAAGAFAQVTHIEQIRLANGANSVTLTDALVGSSDNANHIFSVFGNAGSDVIDASAVTTAANRVNFDGGAGADTLTGGAGNDTFIYDSAAESTGTAYDTVTGFDFVHDHFNIPGGVGTITAIDSAVTAGSLDFATFDTDLASAASGLQAHHAMLFTADAGLYAGQTFLIVDLDGTAGYSSGGDLVIAMTSPVGTLRAGDFI